MNRPAQMQRAEATLNDPALGEALAQAAALGRLSNEDIRAMRETRRRKLAAGVTAALALAVGVGVWQRSGIGPEVLLTEHYETQRGQKLSVHLADGSTLQLDGATSIDVSIGKDQRHAVLQHGEAYFDIAHQPTRPFTVEAGGSRTQVLGTAFDIDLAHRDVKLAVYRGAVRFGSQATARGAIMGGVTVRAGWRSRLANGIASEPTQFDASRQDWRQDWLDTDEMRLGDLVETLNRRGGTVIETPTPALADQMLTGRFKLDSSEQLLGAIGSVYGFSLEHRGPNLRLVPAADGDAKTSSH